MPFNLWKDINFVLKTISWNVPLKTGHMHTDLVINHFLKCAKIDAVVSHRVVRQRDFFVVRVQI